MLEVSRVGVTESDDEIELSLELSIGGRYKKLEKSLEEEEENSRKEISEKKAVLLPPPRSGLSFPPPTATVGDKVETESRSGSEAVDDYYSQRHKREIQALRRQEARRKREEKLRKSASNSNNSNNVANADDKMLLETQQLQSRARDREMRENDDAFVEDRKEHNSGKCVGNEKNGNGSGNTIILKDSNFIFTSRNNGGVSDGSQDHHQGSATKPAPAAVPFLQNNIPHFLQSHPRHNHMVESCLVGRNLGKEENGSTKGKNVISQPVNFKPYYPNGNGNLKRDSGTGGDSEQNGGKCGSEIPKVMSSNGNGSPERTSSAISDYRSTSGKGGGGSSSESGSHSSSIGANEQQFGVSPFLKNNSSMMMKIMAQPETIASSEKKDLGRQQGGAGRRRSSAETNEALAEAADVRASQIPKQEAQKACLPRMPCVSTTGNGPNGKTVTGFLYRYTKTEVSIVCVCHGTFFSPAEFVEHAGGGGGTDVINPLRHITMVPSPFGD